MSVAVAMDPAPMKRSVGRPSKAAPFRELIERALRANPETQTLGLLDLAKANGYEGAKSALYALVAEVRGAIGVQSALARLRERAAGQAEEKRRLRLERVERRALRRAEREQWSEAERLRVVARARERSEAAMRREQASEDRKTDWQARQFRPVAADEQSTKLRVLARRWFASRDATHRANRNERGRWRVHMEQFFGDLEPNEVDLARIRAFVEDRLAAGLSSGTVGLCMANLSSLMSELVDEGLAARNPVLSVPRGVKRLYRSAHDPRTTPFLERMEDIGRLRDSLTEPMRTMFSVAVMSGVRPGELVALEWGDFRSDLRVMHVQRRYRQGTVDVPKSGKGRTLPVSPGLAEVLREWRKISGQTGLVFKPFGQARYLDLQLWRLRNAWTDGLKRAGLPYIQFYQATRHTFASQWVLAGHSIEKLSKLLGHSSIVVTEVYAHLKPESLNVPDVISFGQRTSDPLAGTA